jgi:hypothetical protein
MNQIIHWSKKKKELMNQRFKEDDKSRAICGQCKTIVTTTFKYGNYKIPGTCITVPQILIGYCDVCKSALSIPHQSVPAINQHLKLKTKNACCKTLRI